MFTHNAVKIFIGRAEYDKFGAGYIWGIDENGNQTVIAQITANPSGTEKEAEKLKEKIGEFVAEAINEKLKK